MKKKFLLPAIALMVIPGLSYSQAYSGTACTNGGNPLLKTQLKEGKMAAIEGIGYGYYQNWASSYLAASGSKPTNTNSSAVEDQENNAEAQDKWSCMYAPYNLIDGDNKTAWCEGSKTEGVGEIAMARIDLDKPVEIAVGYQKSPTTYQANNRPSKIKIYVLEGDQWMDGLTTSEGNKVENLTLLAQQEVELKDTNAYQPLSIPSFKSNGKKTFLALELVSVTKGTQFNDTCISEIRNK